MLLGGISFQTLSINLTKFFLGAKQGDSKLDVSESEGTADFALLPLLEEEGPQNFALFRGQLHHNQADHFAKFQHVGAHTGGPLARRGARFTHWFLPQAAPILAIALLTAVEIENVRLQRSEFEKQRLVTELELARTIQQSLLSRSFSRVAFLESAGMSQPCCAIGGDFFDLIPVNPGLCTLVIADVSGKGPPAALQAAMAQGVVQAVSRTCPDLPSLMSTLNECLLARSAEDRFVTAFAATLSSTGLLCYSNAGHPSALWIQRNGGVVELLHGGPLLGVFPGACYPQASVQLAPGDLLILYTDGITEARDGQGNSFGTTRLLDWAAHQPGRLPDAVKSSLLATVSDFCNGRPQDDDYSVLVVRYR